MEPKYPNITANLIGGDGNAFAVIGTVSRALREGGVPKEERDVFIGEATSEGYDHLLQTVMRWVNIE